MTKTDSTTPISGDSTHSLPAQRLARLEDQLNHLQACHAFVDLAVHAITSPDYDPLPDGQPWHLGLLLHQQWLYDQGQTAIAELQSIRRAL